MANGIMELMLEINNRMMTAFYHVDTDSFDNLPVSKNELKNIDMNRKISDPDYNNFRFLSFEEINHKDIMSFYVREVVYDKEQRKALFNVLRRHNFVDAFVEKLKELGLYDDFEMVCGDIYVQIFQEWADENGLNF